MRTVQISKTARREGVSDMRTPPRRSNSDFAIMHPAQPTEIVVGLTSSQEDFFPSIGLIYSSTDINHMVMIGEEMERQGRPPIVHIWGGNVSVIFHVEPITHNFATRFYSEELAEFAISFGSRHKMWAFAASTGVSERTIERFTRLYVETGFFMLSIMQDKDSALWWAEIESFNTEPPVMICAVPVRTEE